MPELTPEAKAAIADAVRIVREDKNEAWWRKKVGSANPPANPPTDPPKPTDPPVDPPKPTDPPVDPPKPDDPPTDPPIEPRKSAYWGVFDE